MPSSVPSACARCECPPPACAWYALRTRARAEKAVASDVQRHGIETFLPTVTRWSRWRDRRKLVVFPLFPGYCFTRLRQADRAEVLRCPLVAGIVSFCGRPAPVDAEEIESLRRMVASQVECDPCPLIRRGDRVIVERGPLRGVVGRLVRHGRRARLELSVELIGSAVSVEVDVDDVRPY